MKFLLAAVFILAIIASVNCTTLYGNGIDIQANDPTGFTGLPFFGGNNNNYRRRCPICDSSVYGYCSDKLFHDSCCCHNPNNPYDRLPYQCQFADCSFLHANSCQEHKLITACCCTNLYRYKK